MAKSIFEKIRAAVARRDCSEIDSLIGDTDVNAVTSDGWNYLHLTLMSVKRPHDPKVVKFLIDLGVDVNAQDRMQFTPLHFAVRGAKTRNAEVVSLLLDAGAAVNAPNNKGLTPLHVCLERFPRNLEIVSTLISAGAELDKNYGARTVREHATTINFPDRDAVLDLLNDS